MSDEIGAVEAVEHVTRKALDFAGAPATSLFSMLLGIAGHAAKPLGFKPTETFLDHWWEEFQHMVVEQLGHVAEVRGRLADPSRIGNPDRPPDSEQEARARELYDVAAAVALSARLTASQARHKRLAACAASSVTPRWEADQRKRIFIGLVSRLDDLHFALLRFAASVVEPFGAGNQRVLQPLATPAFLAENPEVASDLKTALQAELVSCGCMNVIEGRWRLRKDGRRQEIPERFPREPTYSLSLLGWDLLAFCGELPEGIRDK